MIKDDVQALKRGLYRVFWKAENGGGSSIAAVGATFNGTRWLAPTNWVYLTMNEATINDSWKLVERVELIEEGQ